MGENFEEIVLDESKDVLLEVVCLKKKFFRFQLCFTMTVVQFYFCSGRDSLEVLGHGS